MTTASQPARIVMLADNYITGDSRVQKTAISMAEAGHDVTLIGRTQGNEAEEFMLGGAKVRKLPVRFALAGLQRGKRAHRLRWRWPLAYRSAERARAMTTLHRARRADYRDRIVGAKRQLTRRGVPSGSRLHGRVKLFYLLQVDRLTWQFLRVWHKVRSRQYEKAAAFDKRPPGRFSRAKARIASRLWPRHLWRSEEVMFLDYELVFGPVLDELKPDLIHAHDFQISGVAIRAAGRALDDGRSVPVIHDVHEYMPGVSRNSLQWRLRNISHEREYLWRADAVVTVSEELADLLRTRHKLPERPTVVCNATPRSWAVPAADGSPSLRERCGLAPDIPLVVYSGGVAERRGIRTVVQALPALPEIHLALVVGGRDTFLDAMEQLADELGVRDRLHVVDYVRPEQVVPFLSSATLGVIPILHATNHEISLITKYYEYMHARLPIVVSDVRTMAAFTREVGNGEVFTAGDVDSYASAVQTVLAGRDRYVKVYDAQPGLFEEHCWERQMERLTGVYDRLLADRSTTQRESPAQSRTRTPQD